jgi:hypothetical protein
MAKFHSLYVSSALFTLLTRQKIYILAFMHSGDCHTRDNPFLLFRQYGRAGPRVQRKAVVVTRRRSLRR